MNNLTKEYEDVLAAGDINLEIKPEEFFTLLGPSGCGKTTTLYLIAGLLEPDKGEIWIGDRLETSAEKNISNPPQERDVAMVFQDYAIYPHMSVFDNIAFSLQVKGVDDEKIEERVKKTAELLDIAGLLDRKPGQLSGGQRQRVALGRAIIRKPKVFLMDEPLANLDARLRVSARGELRKLQKRLGVTTVYVTHDQAEAMTMSDRIGVMEEGVMQQVGTPDEIYSSPANLFVANFIGSPPMNLIEGKISGGDENALLDMGSFKYKLPIEAREIKEKAETPEIILGTRPEHISILREKKENTIGAEVELIEPVGKELNIHLKVGEETLIALVDPNSEFEIGEEVWLLPEQDKIHVFDKKTGKTIL